MKNILQNKQTLVLRNIRETKDNEDMILISGNKNEEFSYWREILKFSETADFR